MRRRARKEIICFDENYIENANKNENCGSEVRAGACLAHARVRSNPVINPKSAIDLSSCQAIAPKIVQSQENLALNQELENQEAHNQQQQEEPTAQPQQENIDAPQPKETPEEPTAQPQQENIDAPQPKETPEETVPNES